MAALAAADCSVPPLDDRSVLAALPNDWVAGSSPAGSAGSPADVRWVPAEPDAEHCSAVPLVDDHSALAAQTDDSAAPDSPDEYSAGSAADVRSVPAGPDGEHCSAAPLVDDHSAPAAQTDDSAAADSPDECSADSVADARSAPADPDAVAQRAALRAVRSQQEQQFPAELPAVQCFDSPPALPLPAVPAAPALQASAPLVALERVSATAAGGLPYLAAATKPAASRRTTEAEAAPRSSQSPCAEPPRPEALPRGPPYLHALRAQPAIPAAPPPAN